MWRHAANAFMVNTGVGADYMIMGPLRGGGVLVEVGLIADVSATGWMMYAMALTGSPSPTIGNLRGGTSLLQRSNMPSLVFGVPVLRAQLSTSQHWWMSLPMSVRLDSGGQYIIVGVYVGTVDLEVNTTGWALELGGPGSGGNRKPMVDAGGIGVEDGLDR